MRTITEAGALPNTFTTLKLAEAHVYFHTNPGALTFLNGSWYTSRAFNPPDKGGQPKDFPLGIMQLPAVPGAVCNECRSIAMGGSYVGNAATKHSKEVLAFFNSFLSPEMGNKWLDNVQVQTGIKGDPSKLTGPAGRRLLQADRPDQRRQQILLRHPDPGADRQAQGGVHPGDEQRLPGRHDQRRGCRQADGTPPTEVIRARLRGARRPSLPASMRAACRPAAIRLTRSDAVRKPVGTIIAFLLPALTDLCRLYRLSG